MNNNNVKRDAFTAAYLILTENCNLRCTYCFERNSRNCTKYMSKEVAFKTVDTLIKNAVDCNEKTIDITFFGGEPMLCPDLMIDIMKYTEEKCKENNKSAHYSIITNGTLYNDKIEEFLEYWYTVEKYMSIQLSIDGIPEIEDSNRPCANKNLKSSELIESAVPKYKKFIKDHNLPDGCLHIHSVISKKSLPYIYDSYLYCIHKLDIMSTNFAWVIEDNWDEDDMDILDCQMNKLVTKIASITDNTKRFPFKCFDYCSTCGTGLKMRAIDTEGNIYPCHRFFFYDREGTKIGNILDGSIYNEEFKQSFIDLDRLNIVKGKSCQLCIATNYESTKDISKVPKTFYGVKINRILNYYKDKFNSLIEKRILNDTIKSMGSVINNLNDRITELESRKE